MSKTFKYYIIFFIMAFSVKAVSSQTFWLRQTSNTTKNITCMFFSDSLNGWAAGDSGLIIHTTNAGSMWQVQNPNTIFYITDIRFLNSSTGWAISYNPYSWPNPAILKTTNSGINWQRLPFADTTLLLFSFSFQNELTGWAGGFQGTILKTTDGGISWNMITRDTSVFSFSSIKKIRFYNSSIACACGGTQDGAAVIWKIINNGNNWLASGVGSEVTSDLTFIDSNIVFATGGDTKTGVNIYKSTNSGTTWQQYNHNYFGSGKGISFRTKSEGWIASFNSYNFIVTTDTGRTWLQVPAPDSSILNAVSFIDYRNGWAAGYNGAMYKYNTAVIGIKNNQEIISSGFELSQNYPNPFNPETIIKFDIRPPLTPLLGKEGTGVVLKIYDILGKEVTVLVNKHLAPGKYEIHWDASNYPSGVYFYRLEVERGTESGTSFIECRKMILLK